MQVLMSGASGFLGTALADHLADSGHEVIRLVRRPERAANERRWDPYADILELGEPDIVINLSGAGLGDHRWTAEYKNTILASRIETTSTLSRAIAGAQIKPRLFLSQSASGFYGDTKARVAVEGDGPGEGFLAEVVRAWEAAALPAEEAGVSTVFMRTTPVLAASGGFLKRIMPLFKLGVAGRLGSGKQYFPWISLADWLKAVTFLTEGGVTGPVNLVAPDAVTNAEFTQELAGALHRPAFLPVPEFAMRIAVGELSVMALDSQHVIPEVLTKAGFSFEHPDLSTALRWALEH